MTLRFMSPNDKKSEGCSPITNALSHLRPSGSRALCAKLSRGLLFAIISTKPAVSERIIVMKMHLLQLPGQMSSDLQIFEGEDRDLPYYLDLEQCWMLDGIRKSDGAERLQAMRIRMKERYEKYVQ